MIDLHTHTFFSDGVLSVSELVYRAHCAGYTVVAITDHVDDANLEFVITNIKKATAALTDAYKITVLAGVELTYVPPSHIARLVEKARALGAQIVVVHGETTAENVPRGTNRAAIVACADVLAHPGNITDDDARLAAQNGVLLEITTRRGHRDTNVYVAAVAERCGAKLVCNNDAHEPQDILTKPQILDVLRGAGLTEQDYESMCENARDALKKKL